MDTASKEEKESGRERGRGERGREGGNER